MKYEAPELTVSMQAIDVIQSGTITVNKRGSGLDSQSMEGHDAYADWED